MFIARRHQSYPPQPQRGEILQLMGVASRPAKPVRQAARQIAPRWGLMPPARRRAINIATLRGWAARVNHWPTDSHPTQNSGEPIFLSISASGLSARTLRRKGRDGGIGIGRHCSASTAFFAQPWRCGSSVSAFPLGFQNAPPKNTIPQRLMPAM
jgi:hypothetical protein